MTGLTSGRAGQLEAVGWAAAAALGLLLFWPALVYLAACVGVRWAWLWYKRRALGGVEPRGRAVVVTGCDSGFGLALASRLHHRGFRVVATVLNQESAGARRLREEADTGGDEALKVVRCDVADDDSVSQCRRHVAEFCGENGLWGLVNNAGQNFLGDVELTTMHQYLNIANINLFGMVRMCKALLPLLRKAKGRVVNVTSVKGLVAVPGNAAYTISKFGGEAFSDTLQQEMADHGVGVSLVEPGNFGGVTGCLDDYGPTMLDRPVDMYNVEFGSSFETRMKKMKEFLDEQWTEAGKDVRDFYGPAHLPRELAMARACAPTSFPHVTPVIDAMEHALTSRCPRYRYHVAGSNAWVDVYMLLARISPFIPSVFFSKLRSYFFPYIIYK